jgi:Lrp/AsnC family transcriptional regulator for asnA, asnC and gidA
MIGLDLKDRKILYHLNLNSRQSYSQIGKKVGLHRNNVIYRVNRLIERGVIKKFFTSIDSFKFGYVFLRFYLKLQYTPPDIKYKIIQSLVESKFSMSVCIVEGKYDLTVYMIDIDYLKFKNYWNKFLDKYRNHIADQTFSMFIGSDIYPFSFLLDDNDPEKLKRDKIKKFGDEKNTNLDKLDVEILKQIELDARKSTIELAKTLKVTTTTINNRINNMLNSGIIKAFRVDIDFSKLGYRVFRLDINLKDRTKIKDIAKFIARNPYVRWQGYSIGYVDLEFELTLKNIDELHKFMEEISKKYPDSIKDFSYYSSIEHVKYTHYPEIVK